MSWGRIYTNQRCPKCGKRYPSSKGGRGNEITCHDTRPTKYLIQVYWKGRDWPISNSKDGQDLDSYNRADLALSGIRADAKNFDPEIYHKQSKTAFKASWERFVNKYKKASYNKADSIGRHHILPFFSDMQMRDIRAFHIDDWWTKLQEKEIKKNVTLSPKFLNDIHETLQRFMTQAVRLQIIEKLPLFPEKMTIEEKHIPWRTQEQQETLLKYLPEYDHRIYKFLFRTGVRVNEATGLQKSDILWSEGLIDICHTIDRDGELGATKGRNTRPIPLTPLVKETLKGKVESLSKYVFTNKKGKRYSDDYLRDHLAEAERKAGFDHIPLKNNTRHSRVMQWLREGVPLSKASEAIGHSDMKMTRRYGRQIAEDFKELYQDDKVIEFKKEEEG